MASFPFLTPSFSLHLVQVLAHFFWQGFFIVFVAAVASWLLRRRSAQSRYLVHLGALMLMLLCLPATSMVLQRPSEPSVPVLAAPAPVVKSESPASMPGPLTGRTDAPVHLLFAESPTESALARTDNTKPAPAVPSAWTWHWLAPHLTLLYLFGVILMLARLALGLMAGYRMRQRLRPLLDPALLEVVARQARVLGLRFVPAVAYCQRIAVPALVGVLRPMILLPISLASNMLPQEIEAIVTHELAHLRRWDPLVNFLQRIVEAVLFFHPAVWYVSRPIHARGAQGVAYLGLPDGTGGRGNLGVRAIPSGGRDRRHRSGTCVGRRVAGG